MAGGDLEAALRQFLDAEGEVAHRQADTQDAGSDFWRGGVEVHRLVHRVDSAARGIRACGLNRFFHDKVPLMRVGRGRPATNAPADDARWQTDAALQTPRDVPASA